MRFHHLLAYFLAALSLSCAHTPAQETTDKLKQYEKNDQIAAANLINFDDLDFNVFSNQKWDQLNRSHAADIVVHWPDGRTTTGIDAHIEDLKAMFVYAPDTRIKTHPIRIGTSDWTAVEGSLKERSQRLCRWARGKNRSSPREKSLSLAW